jgi:hypothetical protein
MFVCCSAADWLKQVSIVYMMRPYDGVGSAKQTVSINFSCVVYAAELLVQQSTAGAG